MVVTAGDLSAVGIDTPLLVGGAALTRRFTHRKIAPAYGGVCTYAKDAMHGLKLVERLMDPASRPALEQEIGAARRTGQRRRAGRRTPSRPRAAHAAGRAVRRDLPVPPPPDLERHAEKLDLDAVWEGAQSADDLRQTPGAARRRAQARRAGRSEVSSSSRRSMNELKEVARQGAMQAKAVWQFFPARSEGNRLTLLDPESGAVAASWELPRQEGSDGSGDRRLRSRRRPRRAVRHHRRRWRARAGRELQAGRRVSEEPRFRRAGARDRRGRRGVAAPQTAADWGFPDPPETTPQDRFSARYRGKRYSFGYPACPDLGGPAASCSPPCGPRRSASSSPRAT